MQATEGCARQDDEAEAEDDSHATQSPVPLSSHVLGPPFASEAIMLLIQWILHCNSATRRPLCRTLCRASRTTLRLVIRSDHCRTRLHAFHIFRNNHVPGARQRQIQTSLFVGLASWLVTCLHFRSQWGNRTVLRSSPLWEGRGLNLNSQRTLKLYPCPSVIIGWNQELVLCYPRCLYV